MIIGTFKKGIFATALMLALSAQGHAADENKEIYLNQLQDVSSIVFDPNRAEGFTISSPYGIFSVGSNGLVHKVNQGKGYFTQLKSHPSNADLLFASGYKSETEKLGFLRSEDHGKNWKKISDHDVAFFTLSVSRTNPHVIFAADENIQMSKDGGKSWVKVSDIPGERLFALAVSPTDEKIVYAATYNGLLVSKNSGKSWKDIGPVKKPVSAVSISPTGMINAFIYQYGYARADEKTLNWEQVSQGFQNRVLLNLSFDPNHKDRIYGVSDTGAVMISENAGKTWGSFEGHSYSSAERVAKGKALFEENCSACHGAKGVGEAPDNPGAVDENKMPLAPALNNNMHAWHHSDEQLISTILNGSPRNERMIAWKDHDLSREDAESVVAYIKSLWNFTSLSCQGPRHMSCMH